MKPQVNIITLAVDDLERSHRFYRDGLGLPAPDLEPAADHVKFELQAGVSLVLYSRDAFVRDTGEDLSERPPAARVILSHSVARREDVDSLLDSARVAGAVPTEPAEPQPWGYSRHFRDPDGHLWEVVWMPETTTTKDASPLFVMPRRESEVTLREVTKDNLLEVLRLKVAPEQLKLVALNSISIAQAHYEGDAAWYRTIYADDIPVGFVMLEDRPEESMYFLWRFMIDARFQRLGFGEKAIRLLIDHVRTRPGATVLDTSVVPGDGSPQPFYEKLGFVFTGEMEEGERILRLGL